MIFAVLMILLGGAAQAASVMDGVSPWKGGMVPYRFEPALLKQAGAKGTDCMGWKAWRVGSAKQACQAMAEWTRLSGVRFIYDAQRLDAVPKLADRRLDVRRVGACVHAVRPERQDLIGKVHAHIRNAFEAREGGFHLGSTARAIHAGDF